MTSLQQLLDALREIHEYHCGCDTPGRIDVCVAQPVLVFGLLAPFVGEANPVNGQTNDDGLDAIEFGV